MLTPHLIQQQTTQNDKRKARTHSRSFRNIRVGLAQPSPNISLQNKLHPHISTNKSASFKEGCSDPGRRSHKSFQWRGLYEVGGRSQEALPGKGQRYRFGHACLLYRYNIRSWPMRRSTIFTASSIPRPSAGLPRAPPRQRSNTRNLNHSDIGTLPASRNRRPANRR